MDLATFKEIHRNAKPQQKLFLLAQTIERAGDCRVNCAEARRNRNNDEAEYYDRERRAQDDRAQWLYSEIWNYLDEIERTDNDWK